LLASPVELLAPEMLCAEFANAVWSMVRSRVIDRATAREIVAEFLIRRRIALRPTEPLMADATDIALRLGHPVHDCFYLALARAEGCRLVTADERLQRAVQGTPLEPLVEAL
jgi:predicted nucleic acid-binding protein